MSFRFFRPWEDGGQGHTHQTPNPCHGYSRSSRTTTPLPVFPILVEQSCDPSKESTLSARVLSEIPGPLPQEEETHRTEKEDVWNVSQLAASSIENIRVPQVTELRQTSPSNSSKDTNSKGEDHDCINKVASNSQQNCKQVCKSSCQEDKQSLEAHKTHPSIMPRHHISLLALQNDSIEATSADTSVILGDNLISLNSLARSGSFVAEKDVHTEATPDLCAEVTKDRWEMNHGKVVGHSSIQSKQERQGTSTSVKEERCLESFSNASITCRQEHRQRQSKPFQCETCGKSFSRSSSMHRHERTHTGSRSFQCTVCEKTFSRLHDLRRHERIHTGSKPYQCHMCDKAFSVMSTLRVHERIHTGSKPFKCSVCVKAFKASSKLRVHERIHTGFKPFKCSVCKKAFAQSSDLRVHERIHIGFRPFKCTVCEKAYTKSSLLGKHERLHRIQTISTQRELV